MSENANGGSENQPTLEFGNNPNGQPNQGISPEMVQKLIENQNFLMNEFKSFKEGSKESPLTKIQEIENQKVIENEQVKKIETISKDLVKLEMDGENFLKNGFDAVKQVLKDMKNPQEINRVIMKHLITKFNEKKYNEITLDKMDYDSLKTVYEAEKNEFAQKTDPKNGISLNNLSNVGRNSFINFLISSPQEKMKTLNMI